MRYADDLVVMCKSRQQAEDALAWLRLLLADLGLQPKAGQDPDRAPAGGRGRLRLPRLPPPAGAQPGSGRDQGRHVPRPLALDRAVQHARDRIRDLTARRRLLHPVEWIVEDLNRFLRGWAAYFRYGNSADQFDKISRYARLRLAIFVAKRHRRSRGFGWYVVAYASTNQLGLIDLAGTVAAPRPFRAWRGRPNAGGERRR